MSRHKTPLRYPGGKQKLAPFLLEVLAANRLVNGHYAEPYAGGAGVAVELLIAGKVSHIHLNDSSRAIYAFWHSVLNHTQEFSRRIDALWAACGPGRVLRGDCVAVVMQAYEEPKA